MNIPVVYEDDWLLVVDKPSGLLVIPSPRNESRTLTSIINEDLKERGLPYRAHPCHRLDRDTSGLIVYAKGKSIQKKMMDEFRLQRIHKSYVAFVHRSLSKNEGKIDLPIGNRNASTGYRVLERREGFTVIQAKPLTGRTNQIRIHFKQIGHPLLGEDKFAFRKDFLIKAKRLCLAATELNFIHPITKEKVHLKIDLSRDLKEFLATHI